MFTKVVLNKIKNLSYSIQVVWPQHRRVILRKILDKLEALSKLNYLFSLSNAASLPRIAP